VARLHVRCNPGEPDGSGAAGRTIRVLLSSGVCEKHRKGHQSPRGWQASTYHEFEDQPRHVAAPVASLLPAQVLMKQQPSSQSRLPDCRSAPAWRRAACRARRRRVSAFRAQAGQSRERFHPCSCSAGCRGTGGRFEIHADRLTGLAPGSPPA